MWVASKGAMRLLVRRGVLEEGVPQGVDPDAGATDRAESRDGDPVARNWPRGGDRDAHYSLA